MKLRELGSVCLAPVVLAGYVYASDFYTKVNPQTSATTGHGQIVEVQTCERGIGLDLKATTNGLYGGGLQYGFVYDRGSWSASFIPKAGLSYVDHPVRELPQRFQFGVGAQVLVGYQRVRMGVELWHLSNAGFTYPNIGLNNIAIMGGWVF
jgi:hypothetical protein